MDKFVEFISSNYIWFLVITIFLIFALIGYFYDLKNADISVSKKDVIDNSVEEVPLQSEGIINNDTDIASTLNDENNSVNLQTDETKY